MRRCLAALCVAASASAATPGAHLPVPEYEVNLDLAPGDRFAAVASAFNATVQGFYQKYIANDLAVKGLLFGLADVRGPENPELQAEIEGLAALFNLPPKGVQAIQYLYELQTAMVPIENITLPWTGPGCTGIIALNKADGSVYHARNLDFSPKEWMRNMTYNAKFTKGGKEVFRAQMIAAYLVPPTGMKMGPNGFTVEQNTRYLDHVGGNEEMLKNLLKEKRTLSGWTRRKVLETAVDYEAAVDALSTTPYVAPEYNIIAGVKKGTILARNPDGVAHRMVLGQPGGNFECRDDYIIVTNFDYYWHDVREYFDPTGGQIGRPRRTEAQKLLNASDTLTADVLLATISGEGVFADTIFQAIMNVEKGVWDTSLPEHW